MTSCTSDDGVPLSASRGGAGERDGLSPGGAIDRDGLAALHVTIHGARLAICSNSDSALQEVHEYLAPGCNTTPFVDGHEVYLLLIDTVGSRDTRAFHAVFRGDELLVRTENRDLALQRLISDMHHRVAQHATEGLFVHAGVVAWKRRIVVLPGRSFAGKSTLVAALIRAGATYFSDEYAVLDGSGLVQPYPKPLSLRTGAGVRVRHFCPPEALGGRTGTEPLPVGLVASLRYARDATWQPVALSPGQVLLALLDNAVVTRTRPAFALETLGQALGGASGISGIRGEADDVAPALLALVE